MIQATQVSLRQIEHKPTRSVKEGVQGILIAFSILGLWATSLIFLLSVDITKYQVFEVVFAALWQTFLYTGLFITAHDAMHGVVFPQSRRINNLIGSAAVLLYALFSYQKLLKNHWLHHNHPTSGLDPDFHNGKHQNFFAWYFHFMRNYWSWAQLIGLMVIFYFMSYILKVPEQNLTLFWIIPSLLSSLQLFYFGTFLPHREPEAGYSNPHCAETSPRSVFWSFITCYHFGYHQEHHAYPHVAWWKLPEIYRSRQMDRYF